MYNEDQFDRGMSEDEILHDFAKENNYKEDYFKSYLFPKLKQFRREDGHIKEYEGYINGRNRIAWQWGGF